MTKANVEITPGTGAKVAVDTIGADNIQYLKLMDGTPDGTDTLPGDSANGLDVDVTRLPITQPLTDTELRATPVNVDTGLTQPLTDTELRADPVTVEIPDTVDVRLVEDYSGDQHIQIAGTENIPFSQNPSTLEQWTQDTNLLNVLGSQNLVSQGKADPRLKVENKQIDTKPIIYWLNAAQSAFTYDVSGNASTILQISGTWAGTISFEATLDMTNWVALTGIAVTAVVPAITTTTNGIFRFNTAGLQQIRIRVTAYTSGMAACTMLASNSITMQPIAQDAAFKTLVVDAGTASLPTVLGAVNLVAPIIKPLLSTPAVRAVQATYTDQKFYGQPDIQPRIRVEDGGDQQMPFTQMPSTYEMRVASPELYRIMEEQALQLMILNQQTLIANDAAGVKNNPSVFTEVR